MNLDVGGAGRLLQVKPWRRKTTQRIQRTTLQEFGQCPLQCNLKAGMRTKAGVAALIFGV